MAYTVPPVSPRPATVTVASYLLYAMAALQVLAAVVELAVLGDTRQAYDEAYAGTALADSGGSFATATTVLGAVVGLLFAAGYVVLGIFDGKGKNPARIVTWVFGGLAICCGSFGLIGNVGGSFSFGGGSRGKGQPDPAEVARIMKLHLPAWYQPVTTVLGVLGLLFAVAVVILLALPASHPFFRRQPPPAPPGWEPPIPPPTYYG